MGLERDLIFITELNEFRELFFLMLRGNADGRERERTESGKHSPPDTPHFFAGAEGTKIAGTRSRDG